jgi:hypothetical protein
MQRSSESIACLAAALGKAQTELTNPGLNPPALILHAPSRGPSDLIYGGIARPRLTARTCDRISAKQMDQARKFENGKPNHAL